MQPASRTNSKPTLASRRLTFRPVRASDCELLNTLDADPEVRRFVDMPEAPTLETTRDSVLPRMQAFDLDSPEVGFWIAEAIDTGAFLGWFHLRPPKAVALRVAQDGDLELGYRLLRSAWGRGYATEGGECFLNYAFDQLRCPRVTAHCLEGNAASWRVMEKLGMTRIAREDYKPGVPALVYAIDRDTFVSARQEDAGA